MVNSYQVAELHLLLQADDQRDQRLQNLNHEERVALQVFIHDALDRLRTTAEQRQMATTPGPADFTTEWWLPD